MVYKILDNRIDLDNGHSISLPHNIRGAEVIDKVLVVVLDVPPKKVMTENVFGVSEDGKILWQIEKIPETSADTSNCYIEIINRQADQVRLANWNGMVVDVDVNTGTVKNRYWGK
jgi:hypothetical protein